MRGQTQFMRVVDLQGIELIDMGPVATIPERDETIAVIGDDGKQSTYQVVDRIFRYQKPKPSLAQRRVVVDVRVVNVGGTA